jgi:hypothetical protein
MDYTFLWDSGLHTVRIPLDLEAASEEAKWLYVQHKIVSGSHVVAMIRVMEAQYPGLSFSTAVGPSYEKPVLSSSFYDKSLPSDSLNSHGHKNSHRPSSSSSGKARIHAAGSSGGPGRPSPPQPTSTALRPHVPRKAVSGMSMPKPTTLSTPSKGGWQGSKTTTPLKPKSVPHA